MLDPRDEASTSDGDAILDSLPHAVLILDASNRILRANQATLSLFGQPPESLIGSALDTVVDTSDGAAAGTTRTFSGKRQDGSAFPAELILGELRDGQRTAMVRDITEELERENRYRIMVETSKYAQMIMQGPKFVFANQAAVETFGFNSIEEFQNVHPSQISPEYQPNGQTSFDMANEMIGIAFEKGWHRFDWTHVHTDGSEIPMEITLTHMPHYGPDALFAGCADMSDRVKTEEMVRRSQKMDAIGQLTGGIAHDFNNILGIIKGNLEVLKRALPDHEFAQDRIRAALSGTTRGADITKKLLAFSHKKSNETRLVNVNTPIHEFQDLIGKSLTASVKLALDLDDDVWPVEIDPGDFENVILNLALNARDAMPNGGRLTITTCNKTFDDADVADNPDAVSGDHVMVSVSDTGTGMPPEVVEKVFEPFFTTKPEGKGTGLGLSMVYGFVKQSRGRIKIKSKTGVGTAFRIFLPRAVETGAEHAPLDHEGELPRGTETILLVDDEDALLEVSAAQLEDLGYKAVTANTGAQALDILADRHDIDAVFSDVVMSGGMDGFALAEAVQSTHPGLKILLTSGFTKQLESKDGEETRLAQQLSRSLLRKPYNQRELAHALRRTLDEDAE